MSVRLDTHHHLAQRMSIIGTLSMVTLLLPSASPVAAVVATKATPTLTATASGPITLGGTISDTADLSGGYGTLTGTVSFQVFAPADTSCSTPLTPAAADATVSGTVYGQDSFNRTVSNGWGTADAGGEWIATGLEAPGAFAVDPSNLGSQSTATSGDTAVAGLGASTYSDLDTKVRVKFDQASLAGGENRARILVRTDVASDIRQFDYEFALSAPDGKASLEAYIAKRESGIDSALAANTGTGLHQDITKFFWIRGQIVGTNPVTLRVKVWEDGTVEPATWSATATDNSPAAPLQAAGYIDLSSYGNSNLPLTVHFGDFQAVSYANGAGNYTSGTFTPSTTGTYRWRAFYSGDLNNEAASTACGVAGQSSVVNPPEPPVARIAALPTWRASRFIPLAWGATSGGAAVTTYDVRYQRAPWNGRFGAFVLWRSATTATSATATGRPGSTYCFSVRARDALGQVSAWTRATCTAIPLDDRSLARVGSWAARTGSAYYLSTFVRSYTRGAKLVRTGVVARGIAIVATTCRGCGSVRVYWGSTLLRSISLNSTTTLNRKLIYVTAFSTARTGTLSIRVTSTSRRVMIDGLAIRRN